MLTIYIIIVFFSFFSLCRNQDMYLFTLERSKVLKGILPICIILHHISQQVFLPYYTNDFLKTGSFIVGIFFFISGYGLQYKKQNNKLFLPDAYKRLLKLILPTIIPVIIYWSIFFLLTRDMDVSRYFKWNYIWKHNYFLLPYSWFVPVLIMITLSYYVIAHFIKRYFIIFYALILYVIFYIMRHYNMPIWMFQNLFCFLLGMLYFKYELIISSRINKIFLFCIGLSLLAISYYYILGGWIDYSSLIATTGVILVFNFCKVPSNSKIITFLYNISYETYLCHGISFLIISSIVLSHPIAYIVLSICLTIFIAYITKHITNILLKYKQS